MVSAVCELFHGVSLFRVHTAASFLYSLSKLHHSLGQRPHRLLSRMESGLFYCANQVLLRFITL